MISKLLENNRRWAARQIKVDPDFFTRLSQQQAPEYLWIGCADSRVPANQIVGLDPGELFVHRNVANIVHGADVNCLSVLQFAVEVLKVKHVIVCGHYGCGGVRAALAGRQFGLIDHWLWPLRELRATNAEELARCEDEDTRVDRLCEINVAAQVLNVARTPIVQNAWHRGQPLKLHGWVYGLKDGIAHDLNLTISGPDGLDPAHVLEALE
ncbi:carbonate dehydratase [Aquibaculum sediminis]|uniref:carbonate dehydratase n=1 Tax=Aquibaculum sediminis TaxID=3231907 RepID=UPI0034571056